MTEFNSPAPDEVPVVLPLEQIIASTETSGLFVSAGVVFSNGIRLDFGLRDRTGYLAANAAELFSQLARPSNTPPLSISINDPGVLTLHTGGGNSVEGAFDFSIWITPLPHSDLEVLVNCPPLRIIDAGAHVDADAIATRGIESQASLERRKLTGRAEGRLFSSYGAISAHNDWRRILPRPIVDDELLLTT